MAFEPKQEDMIDWEPTGEGGSEASGEAPPSPEDIALIGAQAAETTQVMNRLGERTPAEQAEIASLEQALAEKPAAAGEVAPQIPEALDETVEKDPEAAEAEQELNEYLEQANTDVPGATDEAKIEYVKALEDKKANKGFKKFGVASMVGAGVSGLSALAGAAGIGGAAAAGGLSVVALGGLVAAPAALALGGAYWAGKKLWNRYKANKAQKNLDKTLGR